MKDIKDFEIFDNIAVLSKFLYMDKNNYIDYNNGITTLRITMNDEYEYQVVNLLIMCQIHYLHLLLLYI